MTNDLIHEVQICQATSADVLCILDWSGEELSEDHDEFRRVRNVLQIAFDLRHDLWVCRVGGVAVGYQIGEYAADYLSVRKDQRRKKIGSRLVEASISRAFRDDWNVLEVQCEPRTSLAFWRALGFVEFEDPASPGEVRARRVLQRACPLPPGEPTFPVRFRFYDETALGIEKGAALPLVDKIVLGARLGNGVVQLDRRVLCLDVDRPHKDVVARIEVDGRELCFGKAKSLECRRLGLKDDVEGRFFYIDRVETSAGEATTLDGISADDGTGCRPVRAPLVRT